MSDVQVASQQESGSANLAVDAEEIVLPQTVQGQLIIIGGAEDREGECTILREFVRRSGGMQARIVVMTVATGLPGEVGEEYRNVFRRLGAEQVEVVDTPHREDADDAGALRALQEATGVFFTGGNQARIAECIRGTKMHELLHQRLSEGLVIAGTSAGAAMMPDMMIAEGESVTEARMDIVRMDEGMGFFSGVAIDQHFSQRGRIGRLVSAIAQQPVVLGFGIDENTAIVVTGKEVEVIGEGSVTVLDTEDITHSNIQGVLKDEPLSLCGAKLHILPRGYKFDIEKREPIC
jgi:cyanophycinase